MPEIIFPHIGWIFSQKLDTLRSILLLLIRILLRFIRKSDFFLCRNFHWYITSLPNMPFKKREKNPTFFINTFDMIWTILKKRQLYLCYGHWSHELHFNTFIVFGHIYLDLKKVKFFQWLWLSWYEFYVFASRQTIFCCFIRSRVCKQIIAVIVAISSSIILVTYS